MPAIIADVTSTQVLSAVESVESAINTGKHHHPPKEAVCVIKAGEKPQAQARSTGLLHGASDWQLWADLEKWLPFPH